MGRALVRIAMSGLGATASADPWPLAALPGVDRHLRASGFGVMSVGVETGHLHWCAEAVGASGPDWWRGGWLGPLDRTASEKHCRATSLLVELLA